MPELGEEDSGLGVDEGVMVCVVVELTGGGVEEEEMVTMTVMMTVDGCAPVTMTVVEVLVRVVAPGGGGWGVGEGVGVDDEDWTPVYHVRISAYPVDSNLGALTSNALTNKTRNTTTPPNI